MKGIGGRASESVGEVDKSGIGGFDRIGWGMQVSKKEADILELLECKKIGIWIGLNIDWK